MKLSHLPILVLTIYTLLLTGCGQKGALYLPEKNTTPITTQPTHDNTSAQKAEQTKSTTENTEATQ